MTWPARPSAQGPDPVEQLGQHQVVVDVGSRQRHRELEPVAAGQGVVFRPGFAAVDRTRVGVGAPLFSPVRASRRR